ncbi:histidinol-phosphate transaminase [Brackiella oedipodis]|uniref:histidinol-phosphate transaminase n=1 Tax=Brackiella oedipodis TaxID=124225 RepID=UPI0006879F95|nr:histidinol-phosphate transaminase [Brackiella oedipodis]
MTLKKNHYAVNDCVEAMAPYQAGKPIEELGRELGLPVKDIVKLASNENPLGFSPKVKEALIEQLTQSPVSELGRYPDANAFDLKAALAEHYQLDSDCITLGNGSNDLLELISLAFLDHSKSCAYSQYAFLVYRLSTQARGAKHIQVPAKHYGADLEAMFESIQDDTSVVFLANPNNPTGTYLEAQAIEAFLQKVQDTYQQQVLVVLDEAYTEYLRPEQRYDSIAWLKKYQNLVILRTFSKAYGLAGLRVGFALANRTITDYLNRVRQPFNVNILAQRAAIAALNDKDFLQKSFELNQAGLAYLSQAFDKLGLEYVPSATNFILVQTGPDTANINQQLLQKGLIVRPVAGDGLPEHLRVSVGLPAENERFIQALSEILSTTK